MSFMSQQTCGTLDDIERQLAQMSVQSTEADQELDDEEVAELRPQLRNELAQLHGNANKLLATRLDAILTGDLNSGKDAARAKRKALIRATEALIETVEGQVKRFDARRAELAERKQ